MKSVFVCVLVLIGVEASANTCRGYFAYSRFDAIRSLPSELADLSAQMRSEKSLDRTHIYEEILDQTLSEVRPQIEHHKVQMKNLKKVLRDQASLQRLMAYELDALNSRVETLQSRQEKFARMNSVLARILGNKIKNQKHFTTLKKLTLDLKKAREQRQRLALQFSSSKQSFEQYSQPSVEAHIKDHLRQIQELEEAAKLEAQLKTAEIMNQSLERQSQVQQRSVQVIREFAREYVLTRFDLLSRVESYRALLEERVCAGAACVAMAPSLMQNLQRAQSALGEAQSIQREAISFTKRLGLDYSVSTAIRNLLIDSQYAQRVQREQELDNIEEEILDDAVQIVDSRRLMFTNLEHFARSVDEYKKMLQLNFSPVTEDGSIGTAMAQDVLQDRVLRFQVISQDLMAKIQELSGMPYISVRQYELLAELITQTAYQVDLLMRTSHVVNQDLSRLLNTDVLAQAEMRAIEALLAKEFIVQLNAP